MLNFLTVLAAVFIAITGSGLPVVIAGAIIATVNLAGSIEVLAVTQVFRLGYPRCHDCGSGGNDHYVVNVGAGECKCQE